MLTVELAVKCKTPNCKGTPSVGVITVESQQALSEWMKAFQAQDISCPICKQSALYSRGDLVPEIFPN